VTKRNIEQLLGLMVEQEASDLYLTVDSPPVYRINGHNTAIPDTPFTLNDTKNLALSIIDNTQRKEFEEQKELNVALSVPSLGRFRVNLMRQRGVVALVIRRIKTAIPSIEELALPEILKEVVLMKQGLVLVVGSTGSGKSTTIASMIDHRNSTSTGHIITIEDPIEFVHTHKKSIVSQREIGIDTLSVESALRNCLRQSPDVVLLGEIRTAEMMDAAISFAETGHLCLATLHSNNTNQTMERILNFFPPERHRQIYLQLSLSLRAIIGQRLIHNYEGKRIPAVELLLDSPRIKDLIHKGQITELKEAIEKSENVGMQTFDQALFKLYQNGDISLEDALLNANSPNNLRLKIKLASDGATFSEQLNRGAFAKVSSSASSESVLRLSKQGQNGEEDKKD
jgi:twitching motility protein PilU